MGYMELCTLFTAFGKFKAACHNKSTQGTQIPLNVASDSAGPGGV